MTEAHHLEVATFLFDLLDQIDTISDAAKGDDKLYREAVERVQRRRFEVAETDGYNLSFKEPRAALPTPSRRRMEMDAETDLIYAATARCPCGLGLAYRKDAEPYGETAYWDCSGVFLGTADKAATHTGKLAFNFYEIKSEKQPSQQGRTTRPPRAALNRGSPANSRRDKC